MRYFHKKSTLALSVVISFGITAFFVWNSVQGKNIDRIVIENKTRFLTVESIRSLGNAGEISSFEITFKNKYDKPISIYSFHVSDELTDKGTISGVEINGLADGWTLKPNEAHNTKFSASSTGKITVTVAALLFEDGTGDGTPAELVRLQEIRAGVWAAFDAIIPVFKEALQTDKPFSTIPEVELLETKIKQLNDKDVPDNSKPGFVFARNYIGYELKNVRENIQRNPNFNPSSKITEKFNQLEATFIKLSVNLPAGIGIEGGGK